MRQHPDTPALLRDLKTFSGAGMSYGYPFPFVVISCRRLVIRLLEIRNLRHAASLQDVTTWINIMLQANLARVASPKVTFE